MTDKIYFSDHMEQEIADILEKAGVQFVHESQGAALDFYLPAYDVFIEAKQFHTDRSLKQLSAHDNVILIQGRKSLSFLRSILGQ